MGTVLTKSDTRVREAWGMIERAEPGDCLSVGVALDYVMDAVGCDRDGAKTELRLNVARMITDTAPDPDAQSLATTIVLYLYHSQVKCAKEYLRGYCGVRQDDKYAERVKRLVKLCSWVESTK